MNNIHGMPTPFHLVDGMIANGDVLSSADALYQATEHGFETIHDFALALSREGLNGYLAYYKGKKKEVWAKTTYEAQTIAAKNFNAKHQREVDVILCVKDGKKIEWTPTL